MYLLLTSIILIKLLYPLFVATLLKKSLIAFIFSFFSIFDFAGIFINKHGTANFLLVFIIATVLISSIWHKRIVKY